MPDYRIFVLKDGHIKEPAQIISCPDDEAATKEARQLLNGTDRSLEVWQSDRRITIIGPSNKGAKALPMRREMAGIARNIEPTMRPIASLGNTFPSVRSANGRIARRLHDSIRGQLKDGSTDPLFIVSEALKALEESEPEPPKAESAKQPLPFSLRWPHLIRQKKGPGGGDQPGPNNRVSSWFQDTRPFANNVCRVAPFLFSRA